IAYLFFASGVNAFIKLPVVTENVAELPKNWNIFLNDRFQIENKNTVIVFENELEDFSDVKLRDLALKVNEDIWKGSDSNILFIRSEKSEQEIQLTQDKLKEYLNNFQFYSLYVKPNEFVNFYNDIRKKSIKSSNFNVEKKDVFVMDQVQLQNKITILGFTGTDIKKVEGDMTNLAHKIYDKNKGFVDFQVVYVAPKGTEKALKEWSEELLRAANIDLSHWHFVMADTDEIATFYNQLQLVGKLNERYATPNVYIIDKELNLRGRKGKNKRGEEEYREGYNTISAADLHNEMADDVKVILAEYRLALKKNNDDKNITN